MEICKKKTCDENQHKTHVAVRYQQCIIRIIFKY